MGRWAVRINVFGMLLILWCLGMGYGFAGEEEPVSPRGVIPVLPPVPADGAVEMEFPPGIWSFSRRLLIPIHGKKPEPGNQLLRVAMTHVMC